MDRDAYRTALDTPILVLDDLGAHRIKDFVEDTITAIITHRCNNRKATIFTTNLSEINPGRSHTEDDIYSKYTLEERIGKRAYSRLFEMCKVMRMPDIEDHRLKGR
jgi:DNA replication protein DnaC